MARRSSLNEEDLARYVLLSADLIDKFDPSNNEFNRWQPKFIKTMEVLNVPEYMKVSFLLELVEPHVLDEVRNITGVNELQELTYEKLASLLQSLFKYITLDVLFTKTFYNRTQKANEGAVKFLKSLQEIADICKFNALRDEFIISQFIKGMRCKDVQVIIRKIMTILSIKDMERIAEAIDKYEQSESKNDGQCLSSVLQQLNIPFN